MIELDLDFGDGEVMKTNSQEAMQFLQQQGINVAQLGADGLTAIVQQEDGQQIPYQISDLMAQVGANVIGAKPMNASDERFDKKYRFLVERLGNDEQKRRVLELETQQDGMKNSTIIGSGDEWYAYDPARGQYYALTNLPGMDSGDFLHGASLALSGIGSTMAGVGALGATAFTGPGAILAGAGGAAAGAAGIEGALQGAASWLSPAFREVQTLRGAGTQALKEGAISAPFGALPGVSTYARNALPTLEAAGRGSGILATGLKAGKAANYLLGTGAASTVARHGGAALKNAGALTEMVSGAAANSPLAKSVITSAVPGLGNVQLAGIAGQIPRWLVEAGAKVPGLLGEGGEWLLKKNKDFGAILPGEEALAGMKGWTQRMLKRSTPVPKAEIENLRTRGFAEEDIANIINRPRAADMLQRMGAGIDKALGHKGGFGEDVGQIIGKGMDAAGGLGRQMERQSENLVGAGLRGAQMAGATGRKLGGLMQTVGTQFQPYENRIAARVIGDEYADDGKAWLDNYLKKQSYNRKGPMWAEGQW